MDTDAKQRLREFFGTALKNQGDGGEFADSDSMFVSGRLDSFSMMTLVMILENSFGIEFSGFEFDVNMVDSINDIESLVDSRTGA